MSADPQSRAHFWDRVGLLASLICIIHCTLAPIFIFLLPVLGSWFEQRWVHLVLAAVVLPVALVAFLRIQHRHRRLIWMFATVGSIGLCIGLILPNFAGQTISTVIGGICLSIAHLINLRS